MKLKIILFSLMLMMGLSLVCAFESPVYHIGVGIPSDTSENVTIEITEPATPNPGSGNPSNKDPITNFPDSNPTDNALNLDTGNKIVDSTSGEPKEKKGFFPRITGAVIGTLGTGGTIGVFVFVLGILGTFIVLRFKKRK